MAQPHAVRMHVPTLGNHVEAVFARGLHVSQSRSVGHGSSPKSRWWFRSSRRWQLVLPTPSPRKSGRLHTEIGRVAERSRAMARRSASQRALERTQPGHTHSHACAAAAHAQNHGHTHVRAGSHTDTALRARFEHTRCASDAGGRMCVCVRLCVRASVAQRLTDGCRLHFSLGECVCARVCECVMLHPRFRHPVPARPSSAPMQVCRHRNSCTAPG
jgi:hypothetical protein